MAAPSSNVNYARFSSQSNRGSPAAVIVHQPVRYVDRKAEKYHRNVRKYNSQMLIIALIAIGLSIYANSLYASRPCIDYLVHSPAKDISITVYKIRDMHMYVAYGSIITLLICLAKCSSGESPSYSCYLTMISLTTLVGTLFTGYLAYLAFYSPCSLKIGEIFANTVKTAFGKILDNLPPPDRKVFGESNVFDLGREDREGVWIFMIDIFNFVLYLSAFISATTLC